MKYFGVRLPGVPQTKTIHIMGIIGYIRKERERRFRLSAIDKIMRTPSDSTASAAWRFVNGDDNALQELPLHRQFLNWANDDGSLDTRIRILEKDLDVLTSRRQELSREASVRPL